MDGGDRNLERAQFLHALHLRGECYNAVRGDVQFVRAAGFSKHRACVGSGGEVVQVAFGSVLSAGGASE